MTTALRTISLFVLPLSASTAAAQMAFTDSFERDARRWRTYHRKPPQATFSTEAGDAAHGQGFLRVTCPGGSALEGVSASVPGVEPLSLYTFRAKVRGKGNLWGMMLSGNGWLYASRTVPLTGQWQDFAMAKLTGAADGTLSIYFVTRRPEEAIFEIDVVEVVKEPDPAALEARVPPVRFEAEAYAPHPDWVLSDRAALDGRALKLPQYGTVIGLPAPFTGAPTSWYVHLRPGAASDSYELCARISGRRHKLAEAKPSEAAGWQWVRFDVPRAAAARGNVDIRLRQPKKGMARALIDSIVVASEGDLSAEQLAATPLLDRDRPLLSAGRCSAAPTIDGRGDDACWTDCIAVANFTLTGVNAEATQKTVAKVCYDADRLYVTFRCHEYVLQPAANQLHAFQQKKTKRDDRVWNDDSVVVILGPAKAGPYFDVFCNARGTIDDARLTLPDIWQSRDTKWNGDVEAVGRVDHGFWEAEMAISFASLGAATPKPGERWRLCLGRIQKNAKETSSWCPLTTGFHAADTLGTLVFRSEVGGAGILLPEKIRGGRNVVQLNRSETARPVLTTATVQQAQSAPVRSRILVRPGEQGEAKFDVSAQGPVHLSCDVLDAGTLEPQYLSPRITRNVKASEAKLRLATEGAYSVFLNGERIASGASADGSQAVTVALEAGVNAFAFQVESGRLAAAIDLPGDRVVTDSAWRLGTGKSAKFAAATFNDSQWPKARVFGEAAGPLGGQGAQMIGGDGPAVIRRAVWFEHTYLWPTPEPAQHVPLNAAQHLTFSAAGMRGRSLDSFKLHLAMPPDFEVIGSTGYYGRTREDKAKFVTAAPREAQRSDRDMMVYTIRATQPLPHRPKVRILELFNVFVRYKGTSLPKEDYTFEYWTEAEAGCITECPQTFAVRVTPALSGRQPKKLVTQLWGSFFGPMDDPAMKEATLATMRAVGFNNLVSGGLEDTELGGKYGITNTMGVNFALWCLRRDRYIEAHPEHALLDAEGKRSTRYVCTTALLGPGWPDVARMLRERIEANQPHIVDWDYESSPFTGYLSCYCPRCLEPFRQHAGLAGDTELTPQIIRDTHATEWIDFMTTRNAQVGKRFKEVANSCGRKFSMYSGYEGESTHRTYGVDWRKIGKLGAADHVGCGYGRRKEHVEATVAALSPIPLVTGLIMRPYDRSLRLRVVPATKARILRRMADSTGGILVYDRMPLAGRSLHALAEVFRLVTDHEDLFLNGAPAPDLVEVDSAAEPEIATKRSGKRALVLLMNDGQKPKTMTVRFEAGAAQSAKLYYAGRTADHATALPIALPPGDAEAVILVLR